MDLKPSEAIQLYLSNNAEKGKFALSNYQTG